MSKKQEIEDMAELIRRGVVHIDEDLPDAVAREFLEEILECPLCAELEQRRGRPEREH
jgi:hypothetical protein